ncbi:winged helix-turn-helix transcriptional regulator [Tardiphaga sp. 619_E2_N8_5]|uniref:winged helix-turn-helix transcriptional regulator n=1 Tax=unclassified Tardiphaga TaxID=2631404 RepID=UPI003F23D77A
MAKSVSKPPRRGVRGSTTGRPIMALLDLLGRRWTLRILWELRERSRTSRALREACDDASPTVLQARLSDLRDAGLIALQPDGYGLTDTGRELQDTFLPLHHFAERWSKSLAAD